MSPDGQTMLTGASDGSLVLWDLGSGRIAHRWSLGRAIKNMSYSGDSSRIVVNSEGHVEVFDSRTHARTMHYDAKLAPGAWWQVRTAASRDGRRVVFVRDGAIFRWDEGHDPVLLTNWSDSISARGKRTRFWWHVELSADGRTAALLNGGHWLDADESPTTTFVSVWDVESSELLWEDELQGPAIGAIALSPAGEWLGVLAGERLEVRSARDGKPRGEAFLLAPDFPYALSFNDDRSALHLLTELSDESGEYAEVRRFPVSSSGAISPGEVIIKEPIPSTGKMEGGFGANTAAVLTGPFVHVWRLSDRTRLRTFNIDLGFDRHLNAAFAADRGVLIVAGRYGVRRIDLRTTEIRHFDLPALEHEQAVPLAACADGSFAVGGPEAMAWIDDRPRRIGAAEDDVLAVAFSQDCGRLAVAHRSGRLDVLSLRENRPPASHLIPSLRQFIHEGEFSSRRPALALVRGDDGAWRFFEAGRRDEVDSFDGPLPSSEGSLRGSRGGTLRRVEDAVQVDLADGRRFEFRFEDGNGAFITSLSFDESGEGLWVATDQRAMRLSAASGAELAFGGPRFIAVSADRKRSVSRAEDGHLVLQDSTTGESRRIDGLDGALAAASFSADGEWLALTFETGVIQLRNASTGDLVSLITRGREWVLFTPEGFFDASRAGEQLLAAVAENDARSIYEIAAHRNRPDLILRRLQIGDLELEHHLAHQVLRRIHKLPDADAPAASVVPSAFIDSAERRESTAELRLRCEGHGNAIARYDVFVNGVPLHGEAGVPAHGTSFEGNQRVALSAGENRIEVTCTNESGIQSARALHVVSDPRRAQPDLYVVAFGVSRYQDRSLNLRYADEDARAFVQLARRMPGRGFRNVVARAFVNEEVTRARLAEARALLERAAVDDTVIVLVAGHGVLDSSGTGQYYFLSHDTDRSAIASTAIPYRELESLVDGLAARRKLVLMDTCDSGEAIEAVASVRAVAVPDTRGLVMRNLRGVAEEDVRPVTAFQRNRLVHADLLNRSGAVVFSSSRGGEPSYEMESARHGVFTDEILRALQSSAADANADGIVSSHELRDYVSTAVPRRTADRQHPTVDRENLMARIELPVVGAPGEVEVLMPGDAWIRPASRERELTTFIRKRLSTLALCADLRAAGGAARTTRVRMGFGCKAPTWLDFRGDAFDAACLRSTVQAWRLPDEREGCTPAMLEFRLDVPVSSAASDHATRARRDAMTKLCRIAASRVGKVPAAELYRSAAVELIGEVEDPVARDWLSPLASLSTSDDEAVVEFVRARLGLVDGLSCPEVASP